MEKMLYWPVRWPWVATIVVFLGLTPLLVGPWYVSTWFIVGAAMIAVIGVRMATLQWAETVVLERFRPAPPVAEDRAAKTHL
jgi:hypothetical protein